MFDVMGMTARLRAVGKAVMARLSEELRSVETLPRLLDQCLLLLRHTGRPSRRTLESSGVHSLR
jgi:hypothetical protein